MIKRGSKKGRVEEISFSEESKIKLKKFKKSCTHGKKPQLKYFFNDEFNSENRLFVIRNETEWLGAILIDSTNKETVFTDLILRKKNSPNGIMENLIFNIFTVLKNEGFKKWSLGDVPFIINPDKTFSKEFLINFTGRRLKFAYNYKGLFNFKNKFNPEWSDVYICSHSNFSITNVFKIAWMSNLLLLILQSIVEF